MAGLFAAGMGLGQATNFFGAQQAAFASNAAVNAQNNANLLGAWSQGQTNAMNERLTREAWAREDKAVQRRVADLKAAGLSPVLAAGSAAQSSGPIPMGAAKFESAGNLKMQKAQMAMQMMQNVAQTLTGTLTAYHQMRQLRAEANTSEAKSVVADAMAWSELEDLRQRTKESKARTYASSQAGRISQKEAEYMEANDRKMPQEDSLQGFIKQVMEALLPGSGGIPWDPGLHNIPKDFKKYWEELPPDVRKKIDPTNPENWRLWKENNNGKKD